MKVWEKGKSPTLFDIQVLERQLSKETNWEYAFRFYGGYEYETAVGHSPSTMLLFVSGEAYFEFAPYTYGGVYGLYKIDEPARRLDLDFWEKVLTWQADHPELFEDR